MSEDYPIEETDAYIGCEAKMAVYIGTPSEESIFRWKSEMRQCQFAYINDKSITF